SATSPMLCRCSSPVGESCLERFVYLKIKHRNVVSNSSRAVAGRSRALLENAALSARTRPYGIWKTRKLVAKFDILRSAPDLLLANEKVLCISCSVIQQNCETRILASVIALITVSFHSPSDKYSVSCSHDQSYGEPSKVRRSSLNHR